MSIAQLRKDLQRIQESDKTMPVNVLLKYKGEDLTDAELERVLRGIAV